MTLLTKSKLLNVFPPHGDMGDLVIERDVDNCTVIGSRSSSTFEEVVPLGNRPWLILVVLAKLHSAITAQREVNRGDS